MKDGISAFDMMAVSVALPEPCDLCDPWPIKDVLSKLVEAANILLNDHDYDGHGWEQISVARDKASEYRKRTREEEIEAFERMISDDYKNMEKIEKSGENYMHSRTNSALWVWLARAKLDRE